MTQKLALFLSVSITAFVLVVIGAALTIGNRVLADTVQPTLDPQLVSKIQARETAYRAMIDQANTQLQQPADPTATPALVPTLEPVMYPISPEAASVIALLSAPGSILQKTPDLVDYQGTVAYEVALNRGLVYVDASTGTVLFNGAVRQTVYVPPAPSSNHSSEEDDDD